MATATHQGRALYENPKVTAVEAPPRPLLEVTMREGSLASLRVSDFRTVIMTVDEFPQNNAPIRATVLYVTQRDNSGSLDKSWDSFLDTAYRFSALGKDRECVDWIIDEIDDLLNSGEMADCDAILLLADPRKLSDPLIVTFLGITLGAKDQLQPARSVFYRRAYHVVAGRRGAEGAERLLGKYR